MTEQEYVNVKELTIIRDAIRVLSEIVPEISDVIPSSGLDSMRKELRRWEQKLSDKVSITN